LEGVQIIIHDKGSFGEVGFIPSLLSPVHNYLAILRLSALDLLYHILSLRSSPFSTLVTKYGTDKVCGYPCYLFCFFDSANLHTPVVSTVRAEKKEGKEKRKEKRNRKIKQLMAG